MIPLNLPLSILKRDELYSFIVGLFTAAPWWLHFQRIGLIDRGNTVDVRYLFAWLGGTGAVWLIAGVLVLIWGKVAAFEAQEKEEAAIDRLSVVRHLQFYWAGWVQQRYLFLHILSLMAASIILVAYPIESYLAVTLDPLRDQAVLTIFTAFLVLLAAAACALFFELYRDLRLIEYCLEKGYAVVADENTYQQQRGLDLAHVHQEDHIRFKKWWEEQERKKTTKE